MDEALRSALIAAIVGLSTAAIPHLLQRRKAAAETDHQRAQAGASMMQAAETAVDKLIEPLTTRISQLEEDLKWERARGAQLVSDLATERARTATLEVEMRRLQTWIRAQGADPEDLNGRATDGRA